MIFTGRQRLVNTLDDPYDSYESTATGTLRCVMHDNDLEKKMHGSTTTREYIRRFVRLVRMDKSALRGDTSRQYWTFFGSISESEFEAIINEFEAYEQGRLEITGQKRFSKDPKKQSTIELSEQAAALISGHLNKKR